MGSCPQILKCADPVTFAKEAEHERPTPRQPTSMPTRRYSATSHGTSSAATTRGLPAVATDSSYVYGEGYESRLQRPHVGTRGLGGGTGWL